MWYRKVLLLLMVSVTSCTTHELNEKQQNHAPSNCSISEFYCHTGRCVPADKVCNGVDDCGDKSDETPYCSPCNRTYYGDAGRVYELEVRRPRVDRLPLLCFLNFTAAGGHYGDIVQITFNTFAIGRFVSYFVDGCPDGYVTIRENDLPNIEGKWCGSAVGYTVYFSESSSLNLTIFVRTLSDQGMGYNFDFKISYKFLRREDAIVRYGNSTVGTYRGNLVASTYCDRILEHCDTRQCRIQSPNYPGIYPRNVTCYYRVEVRGESSRGKPLIAVGQRIAQKIHIKDHHGLNRYERQRSLRAWDQCNVIQDYLTVYDGPSTEDPVLVRLCGEGAVPDITGSGAHMLLEFRTSPYDNPFHPVLTSLPGFELDVKIHHINVDSLSFVPRNQKCEFLITSRKDGKNWGYVETPVHSLPPNTTCRYHFQGRRSQNVWISFVKYHTANWDPNAYHLEMECNARLTILDGPTKAPNGQLINATKMGEFCGEQTPKICDHAILKNRSHVTRPCKLEESYVSSGSDLTLDVFLLRGSVLYALNFELRYEFVDTSLEGAQLPESPNRCDRVFLSADSSAAYGKFHSPRSVFYYGRGGSRNLNCIFKFKSSAREKVQLRVTSTKFGDRNCSTELDPRLDRSRCVYADHGEGTTAEISISEYLWPGVAIPRSCICSELREPFKILSLVSTTLVVNFTVTNMNVSEDFENIFFDGEYHFLNEISSTDSEICSKNQYSKRVRGASGEVTNREFRYGMASLVNRVSTAVQIPDYSMLPILRKCGNFPWLIEPSDQPARFVFLKIRGYELSSTKTTCSTTHRIIVYSLSEPRRSLVICPFTAQARADRSVVELFSNGWNRTFHDAVIMDSLSRSFVVEFVGLETSAATSPVYQVSWLEVSKSSRSACPYWCPELAACINSTLWCDNVQHCPSGYDESDINCMQLSVPVMYVTIGGGLLLLLTVLILCTSWCKYRQYRKRALQAEKKAARSNLHINNVGHNGDIYCKRYSVNSGDFNLYSDRKDSLC